jgi:tRNA-specific 2-thiouridylase
MLPPMASRERVLVAMSGGVDSSLAAARLCAAGYAVEGVTLRLVPPGEDSRAAASSAVADAARVAQALGIAHHVVDCVESFERLVAAPFVQAYLEGRTPSPCVGCNRQVKFRQLVDFADRLGIAEVATGHYARVRVTERGRPALYRGLDRRKDQSYFLCLLPSEWLARVRFPLGESTKAEVRAEAVAAGLPVALRAESQELCFAPEGYLPYVERRAAGRIRPGVIKDASGRPLAPHGGVHRFTRGQRKGLGVALGYPAFVTRVDAGSGDVTIGRHEEACAMGVRLGEGRWDEELDRPAEVLVKVRSQHAGALGRLEVERLPAPDAPQAGPSSSARRGPRLVRFREAVAGVSPGQVAVAYDGDRVLGGATIEEVLLDPV